MSQYTADVWLGSASGRQKVTVNSNTWNGAREQICAVYGVDEMDVANLHESRGSSSASASAGDAMGWIILTGIVLGIWAVIQYWYIVVPVAALILAAVLWNKFVN